MEFPWIGDHDRPITDVVYSQEGDLIFTAGADKVTKVWFSDNGEQRGSLGNKTDEGGHASEAQHRAAIWSVDVDENTTKAVTGSADMSVKIWDISTEQVKESYQFESSVSAVEFSMDGNLVALTQNTVYLWQDEIKAYNKVFVFDVRIKDAGAANGNHIVSSFKLTDEKSMDTKLKWGMMDQTILTANDQGTIQKWDWRNIQLSDPSGNHAEGWAVPMAEVKGNGEAVKCLKLNKDRTQMVTCGRDKMINIWDPNIDDDKFHLLKEIPYITYPNAVAFNPIQNHICVGGGEDARSIFKSQNRYNFESYSYNTISGSCIGSLKGGFSPTTALAFHPNGKQITVASESGFAAINNLDPNYLEYRGPEIELVMEEFNNVAC